MRPVGYEHATTQAFGSMKTAGVIGNINAPQDTVEYWVGRYGNYQEFGHAGEDIGCPVGTPVRAMADGVVLWADWGTNLPGDNSEAGWRSRWYLYKGFPGIVTVIQHPGWIGIYAHLSNNDAAPRGAVVKENQLIALSGDTGGVDPHLHREALVDLNYTTQGDKIYGRVDPTRFDGGLAAQGSITEEDMANVTDDQLRRLLTAADRVNGVITDEHAKVLTTNDIDDIANKVLETPVPLAGGGTTSLKTKITYLKQEFNVNQNLIASVNAKVDALAGVVAQGSTASKEEILAQLDASVKASFDQYEPTLVKKESE